MIGFEEESRNWLVLSCVTVVPDSAYLRFLCVAVVGEGRRGVMRERRCVREWVGGGEEVFGVAAPPPRARFFVCARARAARHAKSSARERDDDDDDDDTLSFAPEEITVRGVRGQQLGVTPNDLALLRMGSGAAEIVGEAVCERRA